MSSNWKTPRAARLIEMLAEALPSVSQETVAHMAYTHAMTAEGPAQSRTLAAGYACALFAVAKHFSKGVALERMLCAMNLLAWRLGSQAQYCRTLKPADIEALLVEQDPNCGVELSAAFGKGLLLVADVAQTAGADKAVLSTLRGFITEKYLTSKKQTVLPRS